MFGRRMKHHRGEKKGMNVWVVGLVERATNQVIMYHVEDRSEEAMKSIIQNYVERGSSIYTDGWASYNWMNDAGYEHFKLIYKEKFVQRYENIETGETKVVHTNVPSRVRGNTPRSASRS